MYITIKETPTNISGIYKINYPNGKIYIGQAGNIKKRMIEHNQRAFCNSSRKKQKCDQELYDQNYYIEEYEILEIVQNIEILDEREIYWITQYNSTNSNIGFNLLQGGNVSDCRGTLHPNAKLSEKDLEEIINLLLNHCELSYQDIGNKFNINKATVERINSGKSYINNKLSYPLRCFNHESARKEKIEDYNLTEKDIINLKEDLKYRWDLTIENDLIKKYQIPIRVLRDINQGRKFQTIGNFDYPIRKKNIGNNANLSISDVENILNDLRTTKLSQTEIGKKYGNLHRNTISKINRGETYIIKNYDYPART